MTPPHLIDNLPFYSWQCITLTLKNRDIDLVIPEEKIMDMLIKLLIFKTNTIDGVKDSAQPLKDLMLKQKLKKKYSELEKKVALREINHTLMVRTALYFKILRARAKISFKALKQCRTVKEAILSQVVKTYSRFNESFKNNVDEIQTIFQRKRFKTFKECMNTFEYVCQLLEGQTPIPMLPFGCRTSMIASVKEGSQLPKNQNNGGIINGDENSSLKF